MKIGIISDIHGNSHGLKKVLSNLSNCEKILCAGDITGYYPFVDKVVELLKQYGVVSVLGNHDQYLLSGKTPEATNPEVKKSVRFMKKVASEDSLGYLKHLPRNLKLDIKGKRVLICHGSPWDYLQGRVYPDFPNFERFEEIPFDVIILGQTHYPLIRKVGKKTIINPGSCGQPRDYNLLSYGIWDADSGSFEINRIEWDIDNFKKEALARGTDPKLLEVFKRTI